MACLDYLDRYIWEAEAHANELLDLFDQDRRNQIADLLEKHWTAILPQFLEPPKAVFVFLAEGPSPRDRRLAKIPVPGQNYLWSRARFLALRATTALQQASIVANVKGKGYRAAVRHAAQAISPPRDLPGPQEIALLRLPG